MVNELFVFARATDFTQIIQSLLYSLLQKKEIMNKCALSLCIFWEHSHASGSGSQAEHEVLTLLPLVHFEWCDIVLYKTKLWILFLHAVKYSAF